MVATTNLVSYYKQDEGSGTTMTDAHASADGTITNATVNSTGIINTGYNFDGTLDYVTLPTGHFGLTNMNEDFSINFWFNSDLNSVYQRLYEYDTGGTGKLVIQKWGSGTTDKMRFYSIGGSGTISITGDDAINSTGWHMLTITHDGSTYRMYIDGAVQVDTASTKTQTLSDSTATYGCRSNTPTFSEAFSGNMDELSFWTRTLSSGDISDLYNSGAGLAYPFAAGDITIEPAAINATTGTTSPVALIEVGPGAINATVGIPEPTLIGPIPVIPPVAAARLSGSITDSIARERPRKKRKLTEEDKRKRQIDNNFSDEMLQIHNAGGRI